MTSALVCGMHRSGTSMVASILDALGVHLGHQHELVPPAADNPAGFWEHQRATSINDRLLAALGSGWDAPPPDDPDHWADSALGGLRAEAADLISDLSAHPHWAVKDPRASVTLDFWLPLIEHPVVVVCVRHPLEVVASLQHRNGCSAAHALDLWFRYHRGIEMSLARCEKARVVTTHYRASLDRPADELARLAEEFALPEPTTQPAEQRIDRGHRHHRFTGSDLERVRTSPAIIELYRRLCADAGFDDELGHVPARTSPPAATPTDTTPPGAIEESTTARARSMAVGQVDLERLAYADLLSRFHVRGGLVSILEQRLADAAQRIVDLEHSVSTQPHDPPSTIASEPRRGEPMDELLSAIRELSDRLDLSLADHDEADEAGRRSTISTLQRMWLRQIERSTDVGSRIGSVVAIDGVPADRHLNVMDGPFDPDSLRLWAANGIDAIWVPGPDHPEVAAARDDIARSAAALGWSPRVDDRAGTIWMTGPPRAPWVDQLADLCDDVELRSGRPVSVLDRTHLGLGDLLADRVVFQEASPGMLLPGTVDLVVRHASEAAGTEASNAAARNTEADATSCDLTVSIDEHHVLRTVRTDGRGRIPTVSLIVSGTHLRFAQHLAAGLPTWVTGEVVTDAEPDRSDASPRAGLEIRAIGHTANTTGWPRLEAMLDAARGEVLVLISGPRWPTRGALAALMDAVLHGPSTTPTIAVARCETRNGEPLAIRSNGAWARPTGTRWTTRHRAPRAGGVVMAIGRDLWTHRADDWSPSTDSAPVAAVDEAQRTADGVDALTSIIERAGGSPLWVADSRWVSDPDLALTPTIDDDARPVAFETGAR